MDPASGPPGSPLPPPPPVPAASVAVAEAPDAPIAQAPSPQAVAASKKARAIIVAPPAWIKDPPGLSGDVYYTTVTVGPWKSVAECEEELIPKVKEAVGRYLENYLGEGASKTVNVSLPYIHDRIIRERYVEEFVSETPSVNEMVNLHVRLAFDSRTRAELKRMYREAQVESRLLEVAGGVAAVLLVLGAVFGYLKLDTMTRGFYTRRLQFASAVLILAVAGAGRVAVFWSHAQRCRATANLRRAGCKRACRNGDQAHRVANELADRRRRRGERSNFRRHGSTRRCLLPRSPMPCWWTAFGQANPRFGMS